MLRFVGATLAVLLLPIGLLDWGRKCAKARKMRGGAEKRTSRRKPTGASAPHATKSASAQGKPRATTDTSHPGKASPARTGRGERAQGNDSEPPTRSLHAYEATRESFSVPEATRAEEAEESIPKSTPKSERDRYIRKRMTIAGSCCDKEVLARLRVGSYLEVALEEDNPYDKDAVRLSYEGEGVGYISKREKLPFVTSLKLGRGIYAVITAIDGDSFPTKYEFEAWFEGK